MNYQFSTDLCVKPKVLSARMYSSEELRLLHLEVSGLPQIHAKQSVPVEEGERSLTYIASDETHKDYPDL